VTFGSRARFAEVVHAEPVDVGLACLLVGAEVDPHLDVDASLAQLDALAARVPATGLPHERLRAVLGDFRGAPEDYDDLRSSLLHEVLERRRGLPVLLAVVWCEVARRAGIPAVCLGLPGHVLVSVDGVVVDAFAGGEVRPDVPPEPELTGAELLLRILTNIRALTSRQARTLETSRTRLWATELSLLLPRHPLALRREHGELLVRLGDHVRGAEELETYAEAVPDEDEAESARRAARLARSRLN
jgi:regulator of sirC expression with transglutaminase-like and TPR domain